MPKERSPEVVPVRFCKPGLIAAGAYLTLEAAAYIYACFHYSGLGYEFIWFALLTIPSGLIFRLWGPGLFLAVLMNATLAYAFGWLLWRIFSE